MSVLALEDQMAGMEIAGGDNATPSPTYFDFGALPDDLQLQVCKWMNQPTLNNIRRVDRKRRQLIDDHPKFFEEQRLILEVIVSSSHSSLEKKANGKIEIDLVFTEYCNNCGLNKKRSGLFFIDNICLSGNRVCYKCLNDIGELPDTSPLMGLTLQECTVLVTKGARIGTIQLECNLTDNLVDALSHLIESSYDVKLKCDWESLDALKRILYDKSFSALHWIANKDQINKAVTLNNNEFFNRIGPKAFLFGWDNSIPMPITDDQLSLLFGRMDLIALGLPSIEGITIEGIRRAIQVILLGNFEMWIGFIWNHPINELSALTTKVGLEKIEYAEEEMEVNDEEREEEKRIEKSKTYTYNLDERRVVLKVYYKGDNDLLFHFN